MLTNVIYCRENLELMRELPDGSIDLIYIDPPFFSNQQYEKIFGDGAEIRAFQDRWKGGINVYVEWMSERLKEIRAGLLGWQCLTSTGEPVRIQQAECNVPGLLSG